MAFGVHLPVGLWLHSSGKEGKDDRKQSHSPGEIDQYFDSLVTLTYANLSVSAL